MTSASITPRLQNASSAEAMPQVSCRVKVRLFSKSKAAAGTGPAGIDGIVKRLRPRVAPAGTRREIPETDAHSVGDRQGGGCVGAGLVEGGPGKGMEHARKPVPRSVVSVPGH